MLREDLTKNGIRPTPFHDRCVDHMETADWVQWAGYQTANVYASAEIEYFAARNQCAVMDLTPMIKMNIKGPDAEIYLNRMVTRDVSRLKVGRVFYTVWCNDDGHVIDDGTVYHISDDEYMVCSQDRQYDWMQASAIGFDVTIEDVTDDIAALALQGPTSCLALKNLGLKDIETMKPFDLREFNFEGTNLLVSRTGFTGDLGYELWTANEAALILWDRLFAAGKIQGVRPMGLAALDMTRIEAGFILPHADFMPASHTLRNTRRRYPHEIGLDWVVHMDKGHFTGRRALIDAKAKGKAKHILVKIEIEFNKPADQAIIYHGKKSNVVGHVTSAHWSPTLKSNIALAELKLPYGDHIKNDLFVEVYTDKELKWEMTKAKIKIVDQPFFFPDRRRTTPPADF